ncbi:hypothetical protein BU17DRAFT_81994 [Hysterangium stoloniferum]|nr:hypothetical protein BU17DRAFT_81994 [Hysterangium stoloniferum]
MELFNHIGPVKVRPRFGDSTIHPCMAVFDKYSSPMAVVSSTGSDNTENDLVGIACNYDSSLTFGAERVSVVDETSEPAQADGSGQRINRSTGEGKAGMERKRSRAVKYGTEGLQDREMIPQIGEPKVTFEEKLHPMSVMPPRNDNLGR